MPTEQPSYQQAAVYHAHWDRKVLERMPVQAGVVPLSATGQPLRVTPGAGLALSVAQGSAFIAGSHAGVTRPGYYSAHLGTTPTVTAATADATNPRIDQVVFRIYDTQPAAGVTGDAQSIGEIEIVTGTPTGGATLANRSGAAALPASSLRLADVLVPASFAGPFVQNTHIRDRRPWANGAFHYMEGTAAGNYTNATTTLALVGALEARLELSGNWPVLLEASLRVWNATAGQTSVVSTWFDGAELSGTGLTRLRVTSPAAAEEDIVSYRKLWVPSAGSHTIGLALATGGGGTASIGNDSVMVPHITIRELITQNLANAGA